MSVSPLPRRGGVQFDARDAGRALRISAHPETGAVVLSIWRGERCVATHQVAATDVPELIRLLADAIVPAAQPHAPAAQPHATAS